MMLHMSCAPRDASRDQIEVTGILTNDGCGCGSRENFQSLMGSRERLGRENCQSRMGSCDNWVTKIFSREWMWSC